MKGGDRNGLQVHHNIINNMDSFLYFVTNIYT